MNNKIYYKNRGEKSTSPTIPHKKPKFDFCKIKANTICSLNEVECFLNSSHKILNYIKLYKILK